MTKISATDLANLLADESFLNWLSNNASPQESAKWTSWLNTSEINRAMYNEAIDLHNSIVFPSPPVQQTDSALEKLNERLNQQNHTDQIVNNIPTAPASYQMYWWSAGGAAIAATVLLLMIWQFAGIQEADSFQTLSTKYQEQQRINLPDGSIIILNANSSLRLPKNLSVDSKREFHLNGEAYFEVVPRPNKENSEFTVHTSDGVVTVLGTIFAVYDRGNGTRVALEEGKVMVSSDKDELSNELNSINLTPGQILNFHKGDELLQPENGATKLLTTWWKRSFILDQTSVEDLAQRIQETYGVKLEIQDPALAKRVLAGSIENHDLDIILNAISNILQTPVLRQGDRILLGNKPGNN